MHWLAGLLLLVATRALAGPPGIATHNGLYADLAAQPMTAEGLATIEGLVEDLFASPDAAYTFKYFVQCALTGDQAIVLTQGDETLTFEGAVGLAPEWATGPCEQACQEWVSACILARTNAYGLPVSIQLAGPAPSLLAGEATDEGYFREGAYFGNLFTEPNLQLACRGDGHDPLATAWRICSRPGARCGIQSVGPCGATDGETGRPTAASVCDLDPRGFYVNCRESVRPDAPVHERVITILMRPTSFSGSAGDQCGAPASSEAAVSAGMLGDRCLTNAGCAEGLHCDVTLVGQGQCTRDCTPGGDAAADCGPGAVCLAPVANGLCTPACSAGECDLGMACTNLWIFSGSPEDPRGCITHCRDDGDCGAGLHCNARFGQCQLVAPPADGLEDGEPCSLVPDDQGNIAQVCRGACLQVDEDPAHGLCGSVVNRAVADDCPDRPGTMTPLRPSVEDDMALCVYRECSADEDCTAPLRCVRRPAAVGQCRY